MTLGEDEKKEVKYISQKLCRMNNVVLYRTRYSPVYINFRRVRGSGSSHRGYVIGIMMYKFQHGKFTEVFVHLLFAYVTGPINTTSVCSYPVLNGDIFLNRKSASDSCWPMKQYDYILLAEVKIACLKRGPL